MVARLFPIPMTLREANDFVSAHHRHSKATRGHRFALGGAVASGLFGVAIVGRPVSRVLQRERGNAEVLRVCVAPESPAHANSFLYGCCWRAWRAMGGTKLVTYTLASESGASLRASGYRVVAAIQPRDWSRERRDHLERQYQAVYAEPKLRWERVA